MTKITNPVLVNFVSTAVKDIMAAHPDTVAAETINFLFFDWHKLRKQREIYEHIIRCYDGTWQDAEGNSIKPLLDELEKIK